MAYTKPSISGYNSSPPPDDGTTVSANEIKWATHINKIGDPLKSYLDAVNNAVESVLSGNLNAIADLTSAANKLPYFTGSGTAGLLDFKDEDDMASNSATALPSQQSTKAYVDGRTKLLTAVASTSGTTVDFTSDISGAKSITFMGKGVSTNSNSSFLVRIGDSGGIETSGYVSFLMSITDGGAAGGAQNTTGFAIAGTGAAGDVIHFRVTLTNLDGNVWNLHGGATRDGATDVGYSVSGTKELSAAIDRIQLTTVAADTFDAGSVNVLVEY